MTNTRYGIASLLLVWMLAAPFAQAGEPPGTKAVKDQIDAMEQRLKSVAASGDLQALSEIYTPDFVDIHGSGWIYSREESIELKRNNSRGAPGLKVIKSQQSGWRTIVYGEDCAVVTGLSETYYEVPNPQDLAIKAGTLTRAPASARPAAEQPAASGPADAPAPNPYRIRSTRVWVRMQGHWRLALSQATRVGPRVHPGH